MTVTNSSKPLSTIKVKALKAGQSIKDIGEHAGLNESMICGRPDGIWLLKLQGNVVRIIC